jgi:hypothetical protein
MPKKRKVKGPITHDSSFEVTLKVVVSLSTDSHPSEIADDDINLMLAENVHSQLRNYSVEDVSASIFKYAAIKIKPIKGK